MALPVKEELLKEGIIFTSHPSIIESRRDRTFSKLRESAKSPCPPPPPKKKKSFVFSTFSCKSLKMGVCSRFPCLYNQFIVPLIFIFFILFQVYEEHLLKLQWTHLIKNEKACNEFGLWGYQYLLQSAKRPKYFRKWGKEFKIAQICYLTVKVQRRSVPETCVTNCWKTIVLWCGLTQVFEFFLRTYF